MTLLVGRKFVQNCSTTGSNTICLHVCWPFLVRLHYMALKAVWAFMIWLELIVNDLHTALAVLAVITTSIMSCRSKSQNVLFVCFSFFSPVLIYMYILYGLCLILKLMEWTGLSPFDNLVLAYTGRWTCTVLQCPMSMLQPLVCSCVSVCVYVCVPTGPAHWCHLWELAQQTGPDRTLVSLQYRVTAMWGLWLYTIYSMSSFWGRPRFGCSLLVVCDNL